MRDRYCIICGERFTPNRPSNRCKPCINEIAKKRRLEQIEKLKEQGLYRGMKGRPSDMEMGYQERAFEWRIKRKHLDTFFERSEWQEYFRRELDRIQSDEVLWKNINRETLAEDVRGGTKSNKQKVMGRPRHDSKLYPDTRNLNPDDILTYRLDED